MKICPAILTNNLDFLREKLRLFQLFETIDIDIVIPGSLTEARKTIGLAEAFNEIRRYQNKLFRIHLMCDFPTQEISKVLPLLNTLNVMFIIHQESSFDQSSLKSIGCPIGIAVQILSALKPIEYYLEYPLVQVMSVDIGDQGNPFEPKSLEKVKKLRELGYDREISIDGGINFETIKYIIGTSVNSISVGSLFSKSLDVASDKRKLEKLIEFNFKAR